MANTKTFSFNSIATFSTPIKWVFDLAIFSAFLRRTLYAPEKLDPNSAVFMDSAFNHFIPHALFIKPMIEYLITHP